MEQLGPPTWSEFSAAAADRQPAYLVNNTNTSAFVWSILGRPVPPRYHWTTSGLNFIGFPTPATGAPNFDTYLLPVPEFHDTAKIYRYPGGELGATNPVRVIASLFRSTLVKRGEAFWIRSGTNGALFNRYFGPVAVELQNGSGVQFADNLGTYRVRLKNLTAAPRTVALNLLASENPPAGQPPIVAAPPLLVRGALNTTNLTYPHTALTSPHSFTLAAQGQPGSELDMVLGLNRSAMTAAQGSLYAGVLRFTDGGGLEQIDLPVTALVGGTAGLWVGAASVSQVRSYLKSYATATNAADLQARTIMLNDTFNPPGAIWTPHATLTNWSSVASSADGSGLVAAVNPGGIYTSRDYGTNWTLRPTAGTSRAWFGVASSADGSKLVAVERGGSVYTSTDYGTNWTPRPAAGTTRAWFGVASSADGTKLVAVENAGRLYTSTNSGGNWTAQANAGTLRRWSGVASSADGSKLVALITASATDNGAIYTSTDSGVTWTPRMTDASRRWSAVASSDDGNNLVAVAERIYTSARTLGTYTRDTNSNLILGTNSASYVVTSINNSLGAVARPMPLRLILHTDTTNTHLLQRVYYGLNPGTNYVNATREHLLDPRQLASARRVSAVHLPVTPTNTIWTFSGPLQAGTSLTATVRQEHSDQASNPFLHTYHPDHDNLDARFLQPLAAGFESYTITRVITLTITPPGNDFVSLTSSGQVFTGVYAETVTLAGKGAESRTFATQGTFSLNRINRIGTLTTQ